MVKKIFNIVFNFLLLIGYGYMLYYIIDGIKMTHYLYDVNYYSLNKCIENYIFFGLGTIITLFLIIIILIFSYKILKK